MTMIAASENSIESSAGDRALIEWLSQGQTGWTQESQMLEGRGFDSLTSSSVDRLQSTTQKYLRVYFGVDEVALLPLGSVKEVLQVAVAGILPVPDMPDTVLGLYNSRGEMLWVLDLGQQLGFSSALMSPHLPTLVTAIALHDQKQSLAVIVSRVGNIEVHPSQELQVPSSELFPVQLLPFMQGYFMHANNPVLSVKALIQDPVLRIHGVR